MTSKIGFAQGQLDLYRSYMAQLGAGVELRKLPASYIRNLQPFYSGADLSTWRFGFSNRQPPNNATTDCAITYFNNNEYVEKLSHGNLSTDGEFHWLFHELQHYVQCKNVGSRDAYALMWFGELSTTYIQNQDLATLHDRMPMEADADNVADNVLIAIDAFRDQSGFICDPPSINILHNNQVVNTTLNFPRNVQFTITANGAGGGHDPLTFAWRVKLPGSNTFAILNGEGPGASILQYTPLRFGDYQLKGIAMVPGTNMQAEKTIDFHVSVNEDEEPSAVNRPPNRYFYYESQRPASTSTNGKLTLNINWSGGAPYPPMNVCVYRKNTNFLLWQGIIYKSPAIFNLPGIAPVKVIVSHSGYTGVQRLVTFTGGNAANISVTMTHGSGGPQCYGFQ